MDDLLVNLLTIKHLC